MLTASIPMVDSNLRLTKDIAVTATLSLILTNATMAVPSVMSMLNVKILTAHIHVHAIMDSSVMAIHVVISMNVTPESMIVTWCGSHECVCNDGFKGDEESCYDIDACFMDIPCDVDATCMNSIGSYCCKCNTGYSGNGLSCTKINECNNSSRTYMFHVVTLSEVLSAAAMTTTEAMDIHSKILTNLLVTMNGNLMQVA